MPTKSTDPKYVQKYDRLMLRSAFVSLFWAVISERRRQGKLKLQSIADALGINKSTVSRWFSSEQPNWEVDTISDIAGALNLEVEIYARDRATGKIFAPTGPVDQSPRNWLPEQWGTRVNATFLLIDKDEVAKAQPASVVGVGATLGRVAMELGRVDMERPVSVTVGKRTQVISAQATETHSVTVA
jgi:transcriptional regulator with XRE-family HTH domain